MRDSSSVFTCRGALRRAALSLACLGLGAIAAGCGGEVLRRPTTADEAWARGQWPDASRAQLTTGRTLYVENCAGCHSLHPPAEVVSSWSHFEEMSRRAHMRPDEAALVGRYLKTVARR